jgi:hypothetical protein
MKTRNLFIAIVAVLAVSSLISCENDLFDRKNQDNGILPENFKVDIPGSLSNTLKSASLKSTTIDTINGNHIYWYLNAYIAVGEGAADLVEAIMWSIRVYNIDNVISLSYTSDEDGRVKNLDVISDVIFEDRQWEYQLTIADAESETNTDRGIGMQVFWNRNPVEGIAIFKPYNLDREKNAHAANAMGRIEYSEKGNSDYEAYMIVEIAGLPLPNEATQPYAVENLKMFVGKSGDVIDVVGNSNHPTARFNPYDSEHKGYNWAFVASGDAGSDIAVAEVGLPYSSSDISSRSAILEDYSIKNVLTREMTNYVVAAYAAVGITLQPDEIEDFITPYLRNADAPGYFNQNGFVRGGTAPNSSYAAPEGRIEQLVPFNPAEISNLTILFNE